MRLNIHSRCVLITRPPPLRIKSSRVSRACCVLFSFRVTVICRRRKRAIKIRRETLTVVLYYTLSHYTSWLHSESHGVRSTVGFPYALGRTSRASEMSSEVSRLPRNNGSDISSGRFDDDVKNNYTPEGVFINGIITKYKHLLTTRFCQRSVVLHDVRPIVVNKTAFGLYFLRRTLKPDERRS